LRFTFAGAQAENFQILSSFSQPSGSLEKVNSKSRIGSRLWVATGLAALAAVALGIAPRPAEAALGTGVVDVTTTLGLQNGAAAGTGMVLTASGEILTNNHVIRGATDMRVIDPGTGRSYTATVVGYSVTNDVAVLQVNGTVHLHPITRGNSSSAKVGQLVTAVGNAGGKGGKPATAKGKITGVGRSIVASDGDGLSEQLISLIQINAALQPGDSGGPLVNAAGRVIGMDTAASVNFEFQSSHEGYAIPINRALTLANLIEAGRASTTVHIGSTPFLGVSVAADAANQGGPAGALVAGVVSGSPAEQAGIVTGDTITAVDGQPVTSYEVLASLLLQYNAGATVTLQWIDGTGTTQTADVVTATGPPQ
jgi:S1-C subfamily serine protease